MMFINSAIFLFFYTLFNKVAYQRKCFSIFRLEGATKAESAIEITVTNDAVEGKVRLDKYLAQIYHEYTRSYIGALCDEGLVFVNNKTQSKSYKVGTGDRIAFSTFFKAPTEVVAENIPLNILFEDEHILCINKANGMVVHPAVGSPNGTFVNALLYHLGGQRNIVGSLK